MIQQIYKSALTEVLDMKYSVLPPLKMAHRNEWWVHPMQLSSLGVLLVVKYLSGFHLVEQPCHKKSYSYRYWLQSFFFFFK